VFPIFGRFLLLGLLSGMIRGHDHHRRHPDRRAALAEHPTPAAQPTTPLWRPAPHRRPRRVGRHRLPATRRRPLAAAACPRVWLRQPITCWRRLRDWQRAGVWQQLHHLLLEQLSRNSQLDWSRASLDSISVRAKRGAA